MLAKAKKNPRVLVKLTSKSPEVWGRKVYQHTYCSATDQLATVIKHITARLGLQD